MAQRIPKPKATPKAHGSKAPANELEILHPERQAQLSVGTVTVREYGNVEWLRLLPQAEPLVASMADMLRASHAPGFEDVLLAIAHHADVLMPLVLQAADQTPEWLETLQGSDLEVLLMTWWGVNGHFFVRRATNRVTVMYQEQVLARQRSAGATSMPPSSTTGTGPATSAATPPGS